GSETPFAREAGSKRFGPGNREKCAGGKCSPNKTAPIHILHRRSLTACTLLTYCFSNFSASELMQYRKPVGCGPSSKTWPRCEPQRRHLTSVRVIPRLRSVSSMMFPLEVGA